MYVIDYCDYLDRRSEENKNSLLSIDRFLLAPSTPTNNVKTTNSYLQD